MVLQRRYRSYLRLTLIVLLLLGSSAWYADRARASSGAPILLIVNGAAPNPFGAYLGEILRAEGLSAYELVQLESVTSATLEQHELAILAETALTSAQAGLLSTYVSGGGRLLAMRPDPQIADLFGLATPGGTVTDGYLRMSGSGVSSGLSAEALQIHGAADRYAALASTTLVASLLTGSLAATGSPAVVRATAGAGQTAAFTYDLARNVVMMRQGNPVNADVDTDGDLVVRTIDLFQSSGGTPWVDRDRIPIPQADEQQRLFARLVRDLLAPALPLPQLWYFPGSAKTILLLTADAHGNPSSYYANEVASLQARGAGATFYLSIAGDPQDSELQSWRAQGNELGVHPYAYRPDDYQPYNVSSLAEGYVVIARWWGDRGFTVPRSRTVRNHQVTWQGWTEAAEIAAANSYALDTDFYHWGPWLQKPDGSWPYGYITGSGQPMKFARGDGTIIPVFQQLTELVDEHMVAGAGSGVHGMSAAQAIAVSRQLIDASLAGDYAALMAQFHVDYYDGDAQLWAEGTVDYAHSRSVPVWNADRWLEFVEARYGANYTNLAWDSPSGRLSFDLSAPAAPGVSLTTMLPMYYAGRFLMGVQVDGGTAALDTQQIKGESVAFVSAPAGAHSFVATYSQSGELPTPTHTSVPPTATSTPLPDEPTATDTSVPPTATHTPVTPTATPTLAPGADLVHTSEADFTAACVSTSGALATGAGGGAVSLDGSFRDEFAGPELDAARWASGTWSEGGYTPGFVDGVLQVGGPAGAYVRSQAAFGPRVLEGVAEFGAGPWQHLGFASLDFESSRYLLFSTYNGSTNLYARSNNNGSEERTDLGPLPAGRHRYRVEWTRLAGGQDEVRYYLDGELRATHTLAALPELYLYGSYNSGAAPALQLDALRLLPPYLSSGSLSSCTLDAGAGLSWTGASWQASVPQGASLAVEARVAGDGLSWGEWQLLASGGALASPARYLQYRLSLTTVDAALTPLLEQIAFTRADALLLTPTETHTPVPPTATDTAEPPTQTHTPVPPTATDTAEPPTPTHTETAAPPTPTFTPEPPTVTVATATYIPTVATATHTAVPSATSTHTPTPDPPLAPALANGGFESDLNGDIRPDSWSSDARFTLDAANARSGSFAGKLAGTNNTGYVITQRIGNIVPGKGYRLTGWARILTTSDAFTFRPEVRWLTAAGVPISTTAVQSFTAPTAGWVPVGRAAPLIAPAGAASADVRLLVSSLSTTIYVDDFSFAPASVLTNGGFELDVNADGRPDSWTSTPRFLRSSEAVYGGTYAGMLITSANTSFTVSQTVNGLAAANTYRLAGAVNVPPTSDTFSLTVDVQWRTSANVALRTDVVKALTTQTGGWQSFEQTLAPPATATRAVVRLVLVSLNGKLFVDELALE